MHTLTRIRAAAYSIVLASAGTPSAHESARQMPRSFGFILF
ncbi:MAG: hypothetical protein QOJ15_539 [Bradyrhizobium sp.]|jgi:hypothetical protein|nr:hypothetical protein [Bradyrhizobium sp.]